MSQHRAPRRRADRHRPKDGSRPARSVSSGRHRADSRTPDVAADPSGTSGSRRRIPRPSAYLVTGTSALVVAAAGAMNVGSAQAVHPPSSVQALTASVTGTKAASTDAAHDALGSHLDRRGRPATISRSASRTAIDRAAQRRLEKAAERQARARNQALTELASLAEDRSQQIEADRWVLPVAGYDLTATFGDGGSLWSSDHTGLDFAAAYGTPVVAVTHGVVTEAGYAGAYGNRVIVTHADGSETWYCHLDGFAVSSGQQVSAGSTLGGVGMTGNTTGPHLHFEVRPSPDAPVDPFTVLSSHGLTP